MPADSRFYARRLKPERISTRFISSAGHDPRQLSLDYWLPLMRRFKEALPHVQLSFFTAAEIDYMAKRHRMSYRGT